jgi:murein DD-endopeptidase MepM/ murein hydrolase activator NlpD
VSPNQPLAAKNYQGSRRLPKLPGRRFTSVVTIAFLAAAVVALSVGALVTKAHRGNPYDNPSIQAVSMLDSLNAKDLASRSGDRSGPALTAGLAAPIVWILPVACNYEITTGYEMRWGSFHPGYDMACAYGTPIHAAADGVVSLAEFWGGLGNAIVIDHTGGVQTIYGHASALKAHAGDIVKAGDIVSYMGSTGFSTGDHLHYEIHINGKPTDPQAFMLAHGVDLRKKLQAVNGDTITTG